MFLKLLQIGVKQFDEVSGIEWDSLGMDGAITKAPLAGKKPPQSHRSGQVRHQTQLVDLGIWRADYPGGGRGQSA